MLAKQLQRRCCTSAVQTREVPVLPRLHSAGVTALPTKRNADGLGSRAVACKRTREQVACMAASALAMEMPESQAVTKPMKVLIAGAGIGGLVLAIALLKKGIQVQVFERDLTAIRGEGKYRGPIQVQSNALAALEAIDEEVAAEVLREGCITGDRINGMCDGVTGEWYVKFDTFHPAADRGMPVTRVISRYTLQQVLVRAVERAAPGTVMGGAHVVSHSETTSTGGRQQVSVQLEDGRSFSGDVLVGADGIWSKIRRSIVGETRPNYSGYTCYTGISDYCPADIDVVGYRVFLGNGQYFVSSDVGNGKMQWYAFHKEPAGGGDEAGQRKARLLRLFGHWCDNVTDLIRATPEDDVLRRDIFDRPPIFSWTRGRVALLGDSAHAMQPNLGQGGCMAIEDAYQLGEDMGTALAAAGGDAAAVDVPALLRGYQAKRLVRAAAIHGMAGMAAFMASTYKGFLGEGLGPLGFLTRFKLPHPGRVAGQAVLKLTMPAVLEWVLGGNIGALARSRVPHCKLGDQPRGFHESEFGAMMRSDDELVRHTRADWLLLVERAATGEDACSASEAKGVYIGEEAAVIGRDAAAGCHLLVPDVHVGGRHAQVWKAGGDCFIRDLGSMNGTFVNGHRIPAQADVRLRPLDVVEFARQPAPEAFKVKLQHVSLRSSELHGHEYTRMLVGRAQAQQQGQQQRQLQAAQGSRQGGAVMLSS